MAHHVAGSNSTSSLPIPYTSSSIHSSVWKGTPAPPRGESQDGCLFLRRRKRSHFQPTGGSSSRCRHPLFHNAPETFAQDWYSLSSPPAAFRVVQRLRESPLQYVKSQLTVPQEPAFKALQQNASKAFVDYHYPYEAQDHPNLVRASSFIPQHGGRSELLSPIDLDDSSVSSDSGLSVRSCSDGAAYECYPPCAHMQNYVFSPAKASCEGLGIFSGYSENGFSVEAGARLSRPSNTLSRSGGFAAQASDGAPEGFRTISLSRRLSYGEHSHKLGSKSLHRAAGSRELRHALGWANRMNENPPSVDRISTACGSNDGPQIYQHTDGCSTIPPTRPKLRIDTFQTSARQRALDRQTKKMETPSSKPRLWIAPDLEEQYDDEGFWTEPAEMDEYIQDAVSSIRSAACLSPDILIDAQHYTTISSPKARIITIPPRSTQSPAKAATPDNHLKVESAFSPYTPPETPHPARNRDQDLNSVNDQHSLPITPPSSRIATPRSKDTVQRIPEGSYQKLSLANVSSLGPSFSIPTLQQALSAGFPSQPFDESPNWVLTDLETFIARFPASNLRLNTPCIQYIRELPPSNQQDVTRQASWLKAPHSRFSVFKPLGSRPPYTPGSSPPCPETTATSSSSSYSRYSSDYPTALTGLRAIFPHAPISRLDSLQATYIALHYVTNLHLPHLTRTTSLPASTQIVPPKAAAMLGLEAHTPLSLPSLALPAPLPQRPRLMSMEQWTPERVGNLTVDLRILVRGLVTEIVGRRLGKRDEVLVKAVGQVVRFAERMGGEGLGVGVNDTGSSVGLGDGTIRNGSPGDRGNKVNLGDGVVGKKQLVSDCPPTTTGTRTDTAWHGRLGWDEVSPPTIKTWTGDVFQNTVGLGQRP